MSREAKPKSFTVTRRPRRSRTLAGGSGRNGLDSNSGRRCSDAQLETIPPTSGCGAATTRTGGPTSSERSSGGLLSRQTIGKDSLAEFLGIISGLVRSGSTATCSTSRTDPAVSADRPSTRNSYLEEALDEAHAFHRQFDALAKWFHKNLAYAEGQEAVLGFELTSELCVSYDAALHRLTGAVQEMFRDRTFVREPGGLALADETLGVVSEILAGGNEAEAERGQRALMRALESLESASPGCGTFHWPQAEPQGRLSPSHVRACWKSVVSVGWVLHDKVQSLAERLQIASREARDQKTYESRLAELSDQLGQVSLKYTTDKSAHQQMKIDLVKEHMEMEAKVRKANLDLAELRQELSFAENVIASSKKDLSEKGRVLEKLQNEVKEMKAEKETALMLSKKSDAEMKRNEAEKKSLSKRVIELEAHLKQSRELAAEHLDRSKVEEERASKLIAKLQDREKQAEAENESRSKRVNELEAELKRSRELAAENAAATDESQSQTKALLTRLKRADETIAGQKCLTEKLTYETEILKGIVAVVCQLIGVEKSAVETELIERIRCAALCSAKRVSRLLRHDCVRRLKGLDRSEDEAMGSPGGSLFQDYENYIRTTVSSLCTEQTPMEHTEASCSDTWRRVAKRKLNLGSRQVSPTSELTEVDEGSKTGNDCGGSVMVEEARGCQAL
ncbi:uncharacterized protein LOC144988627 [Oryzias latipes]